MDNLSPLLAIFAPECRVNLHCRFSGRWDADHHQLTPGIVPWHIILHGEARLLIAGQSVEVKAGDILMLPQGSPHVLQSLIEWGDVVPAVSFDNGIVNEVKTDGAGPVVEVLCGEFHFGPGFRWLFAGETRLIHIRTGEQENAPGLDTLLKMLVRESLEALPGSKAIVKNLSATLLTLILRILLAQHQPPAGLLRLLSDKRLSPALLAVLANPAYPWTMAAMAEHCFLSRATFARHFARSYHQTPQAWLTQLRMALASRWLKDEKSTGVAIIAERCGFVSLSSFTKAFKNAWGVTPAQYRKTAITDNPPAL